MEIIELIFKIVLFAINCTALCIVCFLVNKWHYRMETKLDDIKQYIQHVTDRNDVVYINQLEDIKRNLIMLERYEEAEKISKCIESEYNRLTGKNDA